MGRFAVLNVPFERMLIMANLGYLLLFGVFAVFVLFPPKRYSLKLPRGARVNVLIVLYVGGSMLVNLLAMLLWNL